MEQALQNAVKNLEKNGMKPYVVERKEEILPLLQTLIPNGASIGVGGSESLKEIDAIQWIRKSGYDFFDRYAPELTREQALEVMRQALLADVFLTSTNAITEKGELYNVDGNGNRIAAFCYGPKRVIVIAGINKIVPDVAAAVRRVKEIAAPKNVARLSKKTPCGKTGACISLLKDDNDICDGCLSEDRICSTYIISGKQMLKDRIQVILCKENLGY